MMICNGHDNCDDGDGNISACDSDDSHDCDNNDNVVLT